jgi:hypothetical protein
MGMTLYAMGLMAWFCALTIPVGLLLLAINAVWAVKEIMCWVIASEKQQTAAIISTKKFTDKEVEKFMAALKSAPPPVLVPDPPALTAAEREAIVEGLFAIERQLDGPLRGDLGGYARDQRQAAATLRGLLERLK